MNLIVAVDKNWAIGKNNQLLVRIPLDQKFFRETTTGKVVVMGRKTLFYKSWRNKTIFSKAYKVGSVVGYKSLLHQLIIFQIFILY